MKTMSGIKYFVVLGVIFSILGGDQNVYANKVDLQKIDTAIYALSSDLLPNILAKELCSCLFITGAYQRFGKVEGLKRCLARGNLPITQKDLDSTLQIEVVNDHRIEVSPKPLSLLITLGRVSKATAVYNLEAPAYGCALKF